MSLQPLIGIFIGGQGRRMGGVAKGLLRTPDASQSLVERLVMTARAALPQSELCLVGQHPAYANLALEQLPDAAEGAGPIAGLAALCRAAQGKGQARVMALACDLPYLEAPLLRRLCVFAPEALALAPLFEGRWQPLCARYRTEPALRVIEASLRHNELAITRVLEQLGPSELPLEPHEARQLRDWDRPEDVDE